MPRHSLKINAILNMVRRGCAIIFPVITFSYASHKLGAHGIGAYSFSNSVISYFLLLASLGISTYAVREGQAYRDDKKRLQRFVSEVYTINMIMTVVSYVLLGILLMVWKKLQGYSQIVLILSVSIMLTTVGADWINTLLEDYLFITVRYIVVQVICLIVLVAIVRGPADIYKYAIIGMLSSVGGNILNIIYVRRRVRFHLILHPDFKKHFMPMITLFSNSLAIKIYLLADVTILGILMADNYVGYYSAASKVYSAVKEVVNAMILVTVPRFSLYLSRGDMSAYQSSYRKVYEGVATLLFPCVAGLIFQAENILYYLGGPDYVNGATALRILSAAMVFAVGACLFSYSILIPNRQERYFLTATVISAITNMVLNFVLIPFIGIEAAALTTLLSEGIVFVMTLYKGRSYVERVLWISGDVLSALAGTVFVAAVCILTRFIFTGRLFSLIISVLGSVIGYVIITVWMNNNTVIKILSNLKKRLFKRRK